MKNLQKIIETALETYDAVAVRWMQGDHNVGDDVENSYGWLDPAHVDYDAYIDDNGDIDYNALADDCYYPGNDAPMTYDDKTGMLITRDDLGGACGVAVENAADVDSILADTHYTHLGKAYLIAGYEPESGYDEGETIIKDAIVIAVL